MGSIEFDGTEKEKETSYYSCTNAVYMVRCIFIERARINSGNGGNDGNGRNGGNGRNKMGSV